MIFLLRILVVGLLGLLFVIIGLISITVGYAEPLAENNALQLTNCTYLSYSIDDVTTCSYSYGKGQIGYYDCVRWSVETFVAGFGIWWFGSKSSHITTILSEIQTSYPINSTVSCYFAPELGIRYQLGETQTGFVVGIVFLSLFGATLIVWGIAEITNYINKRTIENNIELRIQ